MKVIMLKNKKREIRNCLVAILSSAFLAFGLYHVHSLSGVTEGGVLGMTLLLDHWFGISPAFSGFVMNVLCYCLGWKLMGKEDGSRSVVPLVPFVVFVDDFNYFIELDFMEGIGVVEIVISQSGSVIYSSSENILSPLRKYLQLPFGVSGEYCIEIKGDNGAYVYGCFEL